MSLTEAFRTLKHCAVCDEVYPTGPAIMYMCKWGREGDRSIDIRLPLCGKPECEKTGMRVIQTALTLGNVKLEILEAILGQSLTPDSTNSRPVV